MTVILLPAPFLIFAISLTLILIFLAKNVKVARNLQQIKAEEHGDGQQELGPLRKILEISKLPYYRYIKGNSNYEVAQRAFAKFGHNHRYRFPFGSTNYELTGDPAYAKRIMADPKWTERMPMDYYLQDAGFHKPYGLVFGGGRFWKPASRITGKLLQKLGFYDPVAMESRFLFEMEELERKFDVKFDASNSGKHTFCPRDTFGYLSISVVFHILLGKRNPFDEAVVTKLMKEITRMNERMTPVLTFLEMFPFLRHFPKLTFMKYLNETSDMIYDILREVIADKRKTGKYKEHVEDFVDGLLEHADKTEGHEDGLNEENMLVLLRDMLFAGADTTSATLEHALLFMALHPQVQEKVQAEIDGVIGPDSAPSYEDRKRMPYTEATLHEIYRVGSPVPATSRAKHEGNDCSYALIVLYGIHRNAFFYEKPDEFIPERFLDKVDHAKVVNTENLMPFGHGRRSCPGETAARVAVFVYFVVMLQKYSVRLSSEHPPPSMKNTHGLSRSPLRYYITISKRY